MATNHNLFARFEPQFDRCADKAALITGDGATYTFADVDRRSASFAACLRKLGLERGDRVSVQVEKSPEALCLYLACLRGGFVFHPLNPAYPPAELEYFLGDAGPGLLVCGGDREASLRPLADAAGVGNLLTLDADGNGSLTDASENAGTDFGVVTSGGDELAALLYSSGTTGVPKGIMLSHDNLYHNTVALVDTWGFTEQDTLLHALPIFHVHGLFVAIGCALLSGATMRWLPKFDAQDVIRNLDGCTVMMGVPTYYTRLLAAPGFTGACCEGVRLFVSGSAPLLEDTFHEFEKRTGHRILERYGMTETNMNTSNPLSGERKPGTVGPPLPGVEIRITDDENNALAGGEIGRLQVRGPNVFKGYWRKPDKTAEDFTEDGYFDTGDLGCIDDDGYVSIVGRSKDLVITGGINVYPKEVELVIDELPEVTESAIIGVPHHDFGEAVVAVVVCATLADADEADIIRPLTSRLANFKVPKRIVFVDELPRNSMGKVQKNVLRDRYR